MDWIAKSARLLDLRPGRPAAGDDTPRLDDFAAALGLSRSSAHNLLRRTYTPRREAEKIGLAARFFKVNEIWFRDPGTGWPPIRKGQDVAAMVRIGGPDWAAVYAAMADDELRPKMLAFARRLVGKRPRAAVARR